MVTERGTNKPRGFAFCEYKDESAAQSAIRNLTGREVNGRQLRVDFADNNKINMPGDDEEEMPIKKEPTPQQQSKKQQPLLSTPPPFPMDTAAQQQDPIMAALSQVPQHLLRDAVAQMKQIVATDPDRARQMLTQNPMLALVMVNMQYLLGMIKQQQEHPQPVLVVQQQQATPAASVAAAAAPPPHLPQQQAFVAHSMAAAPSHLPSQLPSQLPAPTQVPAPMVQQQVPSASQQLQFQQLIRSINPQKLQQIITMTPQQIEQLPPQERQQVIAIQHNMRTLAKDILPQLQQQMQNR